MLSADREDSSLFSPKRRRSGCLNCRKRRKKCDETKPSCSRCQKLDDECQWQPNFAFRLGGIDPQHPSMAQSLPQTRLPNGELKIVDITFGPRSAKRIRRHVTQPEPSNEIKGMEINVPSTSQSKEQMAEKSNSIREGAGLPSIPQDRNQCSPRRIDLTVEQQSNVADSTELESYPALHIDFAENRETNEVLTRFEPAMAQSEFIPSTHEPQQQGNVVGEHNSSCSNMSIDHISYPRPRHSISSNSLPNEYSDADFEGVQLEVLDYFASNPSNLELLTSNSLPNSNQTSGTRQAIPSAAPESVTASSPDMYFTYYPDATYKELHSQFHDHMVTTARNMSLARKGTPETFSSVLPESPSRLSLSRTSRQGYSPNSSVEQGLWTNGIISKRRYLELWQNYLDNVAPWLDMFDNENHWRTTVAQMAQNDECLQYSLLALSARQQERKSPGRPYTESLTLYQEAIRLITAHLPTHCTENIAACVLLCVLEMMSSSPRAWAKHLDGCAILLEAACVNGVVGGVREAIFWTFARMDVYKGFISDTVTNLPTNRWFISTDSMSAAVQQFKSKEGSDSYANYGVFLCAGVVNVLSKRASTWTWPDRNHHATFVSRWKALYDLLEGWYNDRPEVMKPLFSVPPSKEEPHSPFDTILYSTPPGIAGNSVYHASVILLLQDKPKQIRIPKTHKTMLWHARQICGIALSNSDHGANIHALQPLWIAGRLMSHSSEHRAILNMLARLEEETGWATSWRAKDLKDFWGVFEDEF